jgi:hypothetical protein
MNLTGGTADCMLCESEEKEALIRAGGFWAEFLPRSFIVCGECGNKRCPRATWHNNPCSGSNEPEQVGSLYGVGPFKLEGQDVEPLEES